jgi:hypothetical protein
MTESGKSRALDPLFGAKDNRILLKNGTGYRDTTVVSPGAHRFTARERAYVEQLLAKRADEEEHDGH